MPGTVRIIYCWKRYKEIINDRFVEPKNKIIFGSFWAMPAVKPSERKVQAEKDKAASKSKNEK